MAKPDRTVLWGQEVVICWWGAELQPLVWPRGVHIWFTPEIYSCVFLKEIPKQSEVQTSF